MTEPPKHRFFAESVAGNVFELPDDEARHALNVLRLTGGETVEVFDGAGGVVVGAFALESAKQQSEAREQRSFQPATDGARADAGSVSRRPNPPLPRGAIRGNSPRRKAGARAAVRVVERRQLERPEPTIELAFAVPKGKRLDWLLEKATELGAARLTPVAFERSVANPELSEHARRRWRGILVAACKQCGSDWLPETPRPAPLADYLAAATDGLRLLGDAHEGISVLEALGAIAPAGRRGFAIRILVGPEGGLTDAERSAAVASGFVAVRIGRTVLRAETAAVALLAAASAGLVA